MRRLTVTLLTTGACCPIALVAAPASAQVGLNRADPTIVEQALPKPIAPAEATPTTAPVTAEAAKPVQAAPSRLASAIVVDGADHIRRHVFARALVPYLGRNLSSDDLVQLVSAIAGTARRAGYPFATASIMPQAMADNVLHVTLDEGTISAVRVIGAHNALADRILTRALVGDGPVRSHALERAIQLVGDIPGLRVVDSKYVRQDGFGILLVNVAEDRASAYLQVDNRGSTEVGPIRATMLASYRGLAQSGDELGLVAATTPVQPREFTFLRARYSAPVDLDGGIASITGSFGHVRPGGSLRSLDVVGNSVDVAASYLRPVVRSRASSLWAGLELRSLKSEQSLLGTRLRDDRLTTLTASVSGFTNAGPGVLRAEIAAVAGLPLPGVTHQGDARISRSDGDARFVTLGYTLDWTADVVGPVSVAFSSAGQLASRPLLATAEIGLGGPAFGRGYDYAERTGDQGVLGSAEVRASIGRVSQVIDRVQFYSFVDGGYVDNLRRGSGGGSLFSIGSGVRAGSGKLDGMFEIAVPVNRDRFDTGDKRPRLSFRLSRSF